MATVSLTRPLILASASPRRAALLAQIGLSPRDIVPSRLHEPPPQPHDDVLAYVQRAAEDKARATAAQLSAAPVLVLSADTIVVIDDDQPALPRLHGRLSRVLGKPCDANEATRMLQQLSGRRHTVISAFCLLVHPEGEAHNDAVETTVRFRALTPREIADYVATGEPLDKAGAYGIQERGAVLVEDIVGDYYTVVGLPLARLWVALAPWRG